MSKPADLLPGTLDMLILKAVSLRPLHGYGVLLRIRQISKDALDIPQGSLYPALYRLEHQGLVAAAWGASDNNRKAKFYAAAVGAFAATALVLAAFGIYGAVTTAVAQRTREIGVRLALGATRRNVLLRAAGYGAIPTLGGLLAGLPLALVAGQVVRRQLFGVEPTDALILTSVASGMLVVALAAALVPALRATRIDPAVTLRHEAV